jgi:hypothetical protein
MAACFVADLLAYWDDVVHWFKVDVRGKNLKSCLCKLCLEAKVYYLWKQRNDLFRCNTLRFD